MSTENDFWDLIDDFEVCMVTTESNGKLHSRPMAPYVVREDNVIRFLTEGSAQKVGEILQDHEVNLAFADPGSMNYASVAGRADISRDRELIREMWNSYADMWFEGGPDNADVAVVTVRPTEAQFWNGAGGRIAQAWEMAKAKLTGSKPDMGETAKVNLSN